MKIVFLHHMQLLLDTGKFHSCYVFFMALFFCSPLRWVDLLEEISWVSKHLCEVILLSFNLHEDVIFVLRAKIIGLFYCILNEITNLFLLVLVLHQTRYNFMNYVTSFLIFDLGHDSRIIEFAQTVGIARILNQELIDVCFCLNHVNLWVEQIFR